MESIRAALKRRLDSLYSAYSKEYLSTDPLEFLHRYPDPEDKEIVGLIASSLAYGRVEGIRASIERVLNLIGRRPFKFVKGFDPVKGKGLFNGFRHRFNTGDDIACLLYFARQMIEEGGSIHGFFMKGYAGKNIKEALQAFCTNALKLDSSPVYGAKRLPQKAGVRFFFPLPSDGSPCKRLNLYLRWMVRRDSLDFGIWRDVSPSELIIPLDTHIARISRNIGLTRRKSHDWKMAEEITGALKRLDPEDPVKYDFALCRLGILDKCPKRSSKEKCGRCAIKKICVL